MAVLKWQRLHVLTQVWRNGRLERGESIPPADASSIAQNVRPTAVAGAAICVRESPRLDRRATFRNKLFRTKTSRETCPLANGNHFAASTISSWPPRLLRTGNQGVGDIELSKCERHWQRSQNGPCRSGRFCLPKTADAPKSALSNGTSDGKGLQPTSVPSCTMDIQDSGRGRKLTDRRKQRPVYQATFAEALLLAHFESLQNKGAGILTQPAEMHRRLVAGVEADVLLDLNDGRTILIFCDGWRYHGGDPAINGGAAKIESDTVRRKQLIGPDTLVLNIREQPLPDLPLGVNLRVKDLCRLRDELLHEVAATIWGSASKEANLSNDPLFIRDVRKSAVPKYKQIRLAVPVWRRLGQLLSREQCLDLVARSAEENAADWLLQLGRGTKLQLTWNCPRCEREYKSQIGSLIAETESKGCPYCGGSKCVAFENSVASDPRLSELFLGVRDEPALAASDVPLSSAKVVRWRCLEPGCTNECLDRPRNRKGSSGYCHACSVAHRKHHPSWTPSESLERVKEVAKTLLARRESVRWRDVLEELPPSLQAELKARRPHGDALSKWGYKLISRVAAKPPN